jgi:Polypeptide deformylase
MRVSFFENHFAKALNAKTLLGLGIFKTVDNTGMAKLDILRYPDPRLHTVAKPVQAVDARIQKLIGDMLETMYDANGIGLAATQIDVHERLVVIDVSEDRDDQGRRGLLVCARHLRRC